MTRKFYSQEDRHRYVWYCVQGIVNLESRSRQVALLSARHGLSSDQIAELNGWLHDLDAARRERERQRRERASVPPVEYAIAHPTRNNLLGLRSGRDRFSAVGLSELRTLAGGQPEIDETQRSDADKAAAYRWVLRGLPAGLAIKKVVYGADLRRNHALHPDEEDALAREWLDELKEQQAAERQAERRLPPRSEPGPGPGPEIVTHLAGWKHYDTAGAVVGPVELEWEPTNPHDPNAIKVVQGGIHRGYVPRDIAPTVRLGSAARLTTVGGPWTLTIRQPTIILPKLLVGIG